MIFDEYNAEEDNGFQILFFSYDIDEQKIRLRKELDQFLTSNLLKTATKAEVEDLAEGADHKFSVTVPQINFKNHTSISSLTFLENRPSQKYGGRVERNVQYRILNFSFTGDWGVLLCKPSKFFPSHPEASVSPDSLSVRIEETEYDNLYDKTIHKLSELLERARLDWNRHNSSVASLIKTHTEARHKWLDKMEDQGEQVVSFSNSPFIAPDAPETIDFTDSSVLFSCAVDLIRSASMTLERAGAEARGLGEEVYRDLLLPILNSHYDFAGGECFSVGGKSDILVMHAGEIIFLAECKLWDGPIYYTNGVYQLLERYTHSRDRQVAKIVFCQKKKIETALDGVFKSIGEDENCSLQNQDREKFEFDSIYRIEGRETKVKTIIFDLSGTHDPDSSE